MNFFKPNLKLMKSQSWEDPWVSRGLLPNLPGLTCQQGWNNGLTFHNLQDFLTSQCHPHLLPLDCCHKSGMKASDPKAPPLNHFPSLMEASDLQNGDKKKNLFYRVVMRIQCLKNYLAKGGLLLCGNHTAWWVWNQTNAGLKPGLLCDLQWFTWFLWASVSPSVK